MDYFEKEGNVVHSRGQGAMDVSLGWLAAALELKECYPDQLCLFEPFAHSLLTGHNCPP